MIKSILTAGFIISTLISSAQQNTLPQNWHLLSKQKDGYHGINLDTAYKLLSKNKKTSKPIIVAILDSGIDTAHEDLKNVLWTNPKEIPNNNIDDDGNGYVDDIHGWNFLGNKNGEQIKNASSEKVRMYHEFKQKFENNVDTSKLSIIDKHIYQNWLAAKNDLNPSTEELMNLMIMENIYKKLKSNGKLLIDEMQTNDFTIDSLEQYKPKAAETKDAKLRIMSTFKLFQLDNSESFNTFITQLESEIESKNKSMEGAKKAPENTRLKIVQDDYYNINDKFYGNNNVKGPGPMHGTHVAGIVASQRDNNIGSEGVANNVKLMALRVVPDGDEYDKDIALAIIYAVDNGAKVINMSFGKPYSPQKHWVDSAIDYAAKKDVLLIHSAGNDAKNLDEENSYPTSFFLNHTKAPNYITVGASTDPAIGKETVVADFSNYGSLNVDVFAPGVKIYSTLPHFNNYGRQQGTSMSGPVVSGLAALLRGYFPNLTAVQTKAIIEETVFKPSDELVNIPANPNEKCKFTQLCKTGGIVDAGAAVAKALELETKSIPNKNKKQNSQ
ncbi:MAG: S8 family serine peptidase [Chitinophagaceae bacterium]